MSYLNYFQVINEKQSRCTSIGKFNVTCNQLISSRSYNLKRHLETIHPEVYAQLPDLQKIKKKSRADSLVVKPTATEDLKEFILESVVNHALPFSYFGSETFRNYQGAVAASLGISLDRRSIKTLVLERYREKKQQLIQDLRLKPIHLKLDSATRHSERYFGLNAQYSTDEGNIVVKTLALRSTGSNSHTGHYVQRFITSVLEEFEISQHLVVGITTDNARNLISGVSILQEEQETQSLISFEEDLDGAVDSMSSGDVNMVHIRCAAHTLQLAVRDALESKKVSLDKVRTTVTAIRTQQVRNILKRSTDLVAVSDVPTRWGSTYAMLQRLAEMRPFLEDIDEDLNIRGVTTLNGGEWADIAEMLDSLQPTFALGKTLQTQNLTPGTFLSSWRDTMIKLAALELPLARLLKTKMEERENLLLGNKLVLAGIYVDPNYRMALTPRQLAIGRQTFKDLVLHLENSEPNQITVEIDGSMSASVEDSVELINQSTEVEALDKNSFEDQLDAVARGGRDGLAKELSEMERFPRQGTPVMEVIKQYPTRLKKAARAVTSVALTQVTVERLFSAVKLMSPDVRASLSPEMLGPLLFLRSNGCRR